MVRDKESAPADSFVEQSSATFSLRHNEKHTLKRAVAAFVAASFWFDAKTW